MENNWRCVCCVESRLQDASVSLVKLKPVHIMFVTPPGSKAKEKKKTMTSLAEIKLANKNMSKKQKRMH